MEIWVFEMAVIHFLFIYWMRRLYIWVYSTVQKDGCTVQFIKCSEWLPSAWMHIV